MVESHHLQENQVNRMICERYFSIIISNKGLFSDINKTNRYSIRFLQTLKTILVYLIFL